MNFARRRSLRLTLRQRWNALTLAVQFLIAGSIVVIVGMVTIGLWVTQQIRDSVTRNAAVTTALYVDSVIAPLLPDLSRAEALGEGPRIALDETLSQGALGKRLVSFKLWKEEGRILYANESSLIGRVFPPTDSLTKAWQGNVTAEFNDIGDPENIFERAAGVPLLEIYSPIRQPWSGEVIAVAEFYESAVDLNDELARTQTFSWLVVATVTLAMMGLLFGIVLRGSGVIATQRVSLEQRVAELSALARQNEDLRLRVQRASRRATELNESFLKRVSADLHDGPAQLVALAALRMGSDRLADASGDEAARREDITAVRQCLDEAITDIRNICHGLVLPQFEVASTDMLLKQAVTAHRQRTGDHATLTLPDLLPDLEPSEKICVYRFVQEALNNAHRHAPGAQVVVEAHIGGGRLDVTVSDSGPGFDPDRVAEGRLGLAGLRDRVESIGGTFSIDSSNNGTKLTMRLNLNERTNP